MPEKLLGIIFWLLVWHAAAVIIGKKIILVTPYAAIKRLCELCTRGSFWKTVLNSFLRIGGGFMAGLFSGTALAVAACRFKTAKLLLAPLIAAVKAVPVASFVIFALFFMKSSSLSVLISFLMVLPLIYEAVCKGIENADVKLIEAADIFGLGAVQKARYLYFPSVMPFLTAACTAAAGMAFKSGTAAEVIGQPDFTLGDMLFRAKIYLETADLFAWTLVIIALGRAFEFIVCKMLEIIFKASQRVRQRGNQI